MIPHDRIYPRKPTFTGSRGAADRMFRSFDLFLGIFAGSQTFLTLILCKFTDPKLLFGRGNVIKMMSGIRFQGARAQKSRMSSAAPFREFHCRTAQEDRY